MSYILERTKHGWLLSPKKGKTGIPMDAFREAASMLPKGTLISPGIASALRVTVAFVPSEKADAEWKAEIESGLAGENDQLRWLRGTDTGSSSRTIFAALCDPQYVQEAWNHRGPSPEVPYDAADFGRCKRLVERMGWTNRLNEVAEKFPVWKPFIEEFPAMSSMTPGEANATLRRIHERLRS